nr:immunoglobulin heavy chain junction region [Macaca mulatta]MOW49868.1 immunoglobulin heavy chain junction region [Macaca mulatta]
CTADEDDYAYYYYFDYW